MDHARNVCLGYSHDDAFRHGGDCRQTQWFSRQAPFPKEIAGSQKCDHGFLSLFGDDGLLDLAALNVEDGIRGFALRKDKFILQIFGNGSPPVHFRQKYVGIERELSFAFHSRPSLRRISFEECRPFYSIDPRRDSPLAATPHALPREYFARLWTG